MISGTGIRWHLSAWTVLRAVILCVLAATVSGCSSIKHVPDGKYLLDNVSITVEDGADINRTELYNFLRQQPNHKVLGFARLQLSAYSLSGRDSTKWYNRWLRRLGQPPVIYDQALTDASARQLRLALINSGYNDAVVTSDTVSHGKKRVDVEYHIVAGEPFRVDAINYNIPDTALSRLVMRSISRSGLRPGMLLDRTVLDNERGRITTLLRDAGYYDFNREYISFTADTVMGDKSVGLTLNLFSPDRKKRPAGSSSPVDSLGLDRRMHHRYDIRRVVFVLDENAGTNALAPSDTIVSGNTCFIYGSDRYLSHKLLDEMCYIQPGHPYSASAVNRTYEALGRLGIIKFINIEMKPVGSIGDIGLLDAYIYLSRNKKQSMSVEVEGTNSEGDLGFGVGLTYQHRNLARGSQLLSAKLRGSYESLSGNLDGLINNRYTEFAGEVGITFPKFECPFLSKSFKQRRLASTEFTISANYQERPEYTRVIFGTAWKWKWQQQRAGFTRRQTYDLIDINYVRLPKSTLNFIDEIAPSNPLLRYSYEDHFIMRMGYTFSRTNRRAPAATVNSLSVQPVVTSIRASVECAGNLLYGISRMVGQKRSDGVYKILGIQYAQYVKGEFDYTLTRNFDDRNSVSFHSGFGVAYPYGNSSMVPFEKRFYAGGANGVRGWGVRTLGPGSYDARNSVTDFINQCGDIRLDLSLEYRAKLFWVLEGAVFVDAGNIWTIRDYENQPGGLFKFDRFYKEIAASYGIGLRLDFTYFLLRFDLGMKAHNPARNQEPWPIIHPNWHRDANFHFAVGYPF
ncbi:MAG: BamA/TamA family outer membrane protein [Muribaculaceae bacterium]|nr:BamA/TamA family outer membrane protein [Muribaculaceae bacterium]